MYERVLLALSRWARPRAGALFRYGLIDRIRRVGDGNGVTVLAFGFGDAGELRCVLRGESPGVCATLKAVKIGTAHTLKHLGVDGALQVAHRSPVPEPRATDAVVWAHRAPLTGLRAPREPLATPWSSHRDLLGYREAVFFDAKPLRRAVDPDEIDRRCGGHPDAAGEPDDTWALATLLRLSAAVIGVVPTDRRCFGLFVHLARSHAYRTREVARTIGVTPRRVRQLVARPAPHFDLVRRTLADPRLQRVP